MSHPAAWHPDPVGRHEVRYWNGSEWTHHVSDRGILGVDPLERIQVTDETSRRRTRQFVRSSLRGDGSVTTYHAVAMQAKERGDYATTINAALDAWDRFGLCWEVGDALFDGFLEWRKIDGFDRGEAFDLAIGLYRRGRLELPANLGDAPLPDLTVTPPRQVTIDWVTLFNLAEWFFDVLPDGERRALAQFHFDEVLRLPPLVIAECQQWLGRLHDKYGVGDMEPVHRAAFAAFEQRERDR